MEQRKRTIAIGLMISWRSISGNFKNIVEGSGGLPLYSLDHHASTRNRFWAISTKNRKIRNALPASLLCIKVQKTENSKWMRSLLNFQILLQNSVTNLITTIDLHVFE
jgi:hypothetical protein